MSIKKKKKLTEIKINNGHYSYFVIYAYYNNINNY